MGYEILSHVAAIAAGGVLISGAAVAACAALRRVSASLRHLLLVGVFVSLLALPAMSFLTPAWNLPVIPASGIFGTEPLRDEVRPGAYGEALPSADGKANSDPAEIRGDAVEKAAGLPAPGTGGQPSAPMVTRAFVARHLPSIAMVIWATGALIVLVIQLVRWAGAGFIAEMATTVENNGLLSMAERIRWEMGIKRRVGLLRSEMAAVSMVWGIRQPYVVLPSCAESWPADKVEAVLRHELAHVKRWDNLLQIIAVVACGLYWFNPFVWIAMKRLHFEREVACDNAVLNAGCIASTYAKHLMEISMSLSGPRSRRIIPAVMAHSSDVKKRLVSVLNPGISRRTAGIPTAAICVGIVLLLSLPVSALRLGPREENRYLRGEKLTMKGSYTATGSEVFIDEADILDNKSKIRIEAKNVELDPGEPLGCRLEGNGYLRITRRKGRKDLEYEVSQRREGGEYLIVKTFSVNGAKSDFDEERLREFRDIACELYAILDIGEDAGEGDFGRAHRMIAIRNEDPREDAGRKEAGAGGDAPGRHTGPTITIRNGRINSDEGVVEVDGTIMNEGWAFRGSMEGTRPRVVIVDGRLRNEEAFIEIVGRNLVLDPEAEKGFRFNEDEGYMRLTRYADEAKIEYECRREKKGRKLVTTYDCYLDGERVEPDEKGERELKKMLESAYRWLTAGESVPTEPPAPEAAPLPDVAPAPEAAPVPPASPERPARETRSPELEIRSERRAAREAVRAAARAATRAERRAVERLRARADYERYEDENERFAEGLLEVIEEIGREFEDVEARFEETLGSRRAEEAITKAYEVRRDRIERIKERAVARFRSGRETAIAVEGCREILDEFEAVAASALESCDRGEARSDLRNALVDFYGDLIKSIDEIVVEIEDGQWAEEGSELFDAQMDICREVRKALEKTRERIESFD